jgi:hypothetical protein
MSKKILLFALLFAGTTAAFAQSVRGNVGIKVQPMLQIFPNPAAAELNILSSEPIHKVMIVNILGQTVYEQNFESNNIKIDVGHLPPGMYYVKADQTAPQKISKN